jgi:hypothetical protein
LKQAKEDREERTVHQHCLGDIICIMTRDDMVDPQLGCSPIQSLSSEDTAEGTCQERTKGMAATATVSCWLRTQANEERILARRWEGGRRGGLTVVLLPNGLDDPIHRPAVELVVGEDLEREVVLLLVSLDRLRAATIGQVTHHD